MKKILFRSLLVIMAFALSTQAEAKKNAKEKAKIQMPSKKVPSRKWKNLLAKDLAGWEVWTGVPDKSVKNLPASYKVPANGVPKEPIGLGDPMGIYTVTTDTDGEPMLNISGEVYAGLTSLESYSDYHLTMLFKWGEKKYAPRLDKKRDNGLLYHCYGEHGAFWDVWMRCLESQIQEGDFGDLYILKGTSATVKVDETNHWDPNSSKTAKRAMRSFDAESPYGEWTRVDLYVIDDVAIHVVNGQVVLALQDAKDHEGNKLSAGKIQIQCEGAECYGKDICIRPIKKFPKKIRNAAGL